MKETKASSKQYWRGVKAVFQERVSRIQGLAISIELQWDFNLSQEIGFSRKQRLLDDIGFQPVLTRQL